jgi:hypothetical protein
VARERIGMRALGPWLGKPPRPVDRAAAGIRPYRSGDLGACEDLIRTEFSDLDLRPEWTCDRLAHQLQYNDVPRTLVKESGGRVLGFLNYFPVAIGAKTTLRAAAIDLLVFGQIPRNERSDLLGAALEQMASEGHQVAMLPAFPCYPAAPLWATGFLPSPGQYLLTAGHCAPGFGLEGARRVMYPLR